MRITCFGTGYVGLVTAACFADAGHNVCCVDIDKRRIEALQQGHIPFVEPGLPELLAGCSDRLRYTTDAMAALNDVDIVFIAVGTPTGDDGAADVSQVMAVANTIGQLTSDGVVVAVKSTVPVGCGAQIAQVIADVLTTRGVTWSCPVASCPEFLREGSAVADCLHPSRIVIGTDDERAAQLLSAAYERWHDAGTPIVVVDRPTAELGKYAANTMLAARLSVMNELSLLCERSGADIRGIETIVAGDERIGTQFLAAGCGYGGSCFPKDVRALAQMLRSVGITPMLAEAIDAANMRQQQQLFDKIQKHFVSLQGKCIAVWGLAFKPHTDDIRYAPSRALIEALWAHGAIVQAYDPAAHDNWRAVYGERDDIVLCTDQYQACRNADALVLCTEWPEFRTPDYDSVQLLLTQPVVFDGRNVLDTAALEQRGFTWYGIGRVMSGGHPR